MSAACANPSELPESGQETVEQSAEVGAMLPVAAHMKLLLDAPEGLLMRNVVS